MVAGGMGMYGGDRPRVSQCLHLFQINTMQCGWVWKEIIDPLSRFKTLILLLYSDDCSMNGYG